MIETLLLIAAAGALPQDQQAIVREALLAGAASALEERKTEALKSFERAALVAPEHPGVLDALGAAALHLGDLNRAKSALAESPRMAAYLAMAEVQQGAGGLARARTALASQEKLTDAEAQPTALFLGALAFADAGQPDRADKLLQRALQTSEGALDEAFAPDPAVAMARAVIRAIDALDESPGGQARAVLAMALLQARRRAEAIRLAEQALDRPGTRGAALRVMILAENAVDTRRALEHVERVLTEDPKAEDALVARAVLLYRSGDEDRARKAIASAPPIEDAHLRAELERTRAELALRAKDSATAVDAAESAIRADPKSNESVALLVRALLESKKLERARAFAGEILRRKPTEVDPFDLLASVSGAAGEERKAAEQRLRSRAFRAQMARLDAVVREREEVFRIVRDAERTGVGVAGLEALRGEHPLLSLPIDLALARHGSRGFARAARDRIFAGCTPSLLTLLKHRGPWEVLSVDISPYGELQTVEAPLTAAEPSRCTVKIKRNTRLRGGRR